MHKRKTLLFMTIFVIIVIYLPGSLFAENAAVTQIDLIFDASGSMWGKIKGKEKIRIAKESIYDIIDELGQKKNIQVALRVYGHLNNKCTNSELEIPMNNVDVEALKAKIKTIKPKGKTPISYSLIQAVDDFKKELSGEKVIILITDGIESCQADPCQTALELKNAGIITKMHIIGFGMKKYELSALQCIAEPTGGMVIGASSARDLTEALDKIVEETLPVNLEIKALDAQNNNIFANYEIYQNGDSSMKIVAAGDTSMGQKASLFLSAGNYDIKVINNSTDAAIWFRNIAIKENQKTVKKALFAERTIKIKIKNASGKYVYGDVYIYDKNGNEIKHADTSMGNQATFTVLPDIYDIKAFDYETRKESWQKDVDVREVKEYKSEISVE